ncbi:MAG: hypothetical protein MSC54_01325, partial [Clostridiales bacterium]|nr:hypothetical protein [Clostridiales bacterium]
FFMICSPLHFLVCWLDVIKRGRSVREQSGLFLTKWERNETLLINGRLYAFVAAKITRKVASHKAVIVAPTGEDGIGTRNGTHIGAPFCRLAAICFDGHTIEL